MSVARFAIRRPVTVTMGFLSLMVIGMVASRLLPLEYFPELDIPFLFIQVPYQGSTPEEVERELSKPIEEVLATLPGIKQIESFSGIDESTVQIEFDWGIDIGVMAVEARERVEAIRDQLPTDVRQINVFKFNFSDQPVLTLRISSQRDLSRSFDMLTRKLARPLERVPGVARVELQGLEPREIRIELIADRITAHGIDLNDLQRRLRQMNFSASAGLIDADNVRYRVNPKGEFTSIESIGEQIISDNGIRLNDIADVQYAAARRDYARHLDQRYAIGLQIFKETGSNLVDVGERVLAEVEAIGNDPEMQGINLFFLENQSAGVTDSLSELLKAGLMGALLSLLVLYFFLRNVATTVMVAISVPIAITITLGAMYFLGLSLNILSMMGLMLAVGMLVDNSVVVSESIFTERENNPGHKIESTLKGTRAVSLAVLAGTVTSSAVFLPIIFGEPDQISIFLTHVAVAIVVSLAVSLLIAQTIIPLVSSWQKPPKPAKDGLIKKIRDRYVRMLQWTIRKRGWSLAIISGVFLSVLIPLTIVETDMFPENQTRQLFLQYNLDSRYPLSRIKEEAVDPIETWLYANADSLDIRSVYTYYDENGNAQSSILLTDDKNATRNSTEISKDIVEGMPTIAIGRPSFERNRSGSDGVSLSLTGRSSEVLEELGEEVVRILSTIDGLDGARSSRRAGEKEFQLQVDRERANQLGFSTQEVANAVAVAMRGSPLQEFKGPEGEIPVTLRFRDADKANRESLADIKLRNSNGEQVPLFALVNISEGVSAPTIRRINRETGIRISANLNDLTLEKAREEIQKKMDLVHLPPGYKWSFGRGFDEDQEAAVKMMLNMLLAIALIYIVLAAQFESLLYPVSMICSILFSFVGVYWFFLFTGTTFSIMSMIGILILIGVVVNNGIVLIDHINQLRLAGFSREDAVLRAGHDRLRPILMTVGTTVLGLAPLCIGTTQLGGDGPPYFPMARAIVGGLLFSTVVSLLFLPTIYLVLDSVRNMAIRIKNNLMGFRPRMPGWIKGRKLKLGFKRAGD